eukprot:c6349_g1_i1.p2 GENE.c6349_g1_i1~~c6349_g1_i1.p2  ORF type:complete len:236 (+),score=17.29 c6349_g1_i1:40-708(+)
MDEPRSQFSWDNVYSTKAASDLSWTQDAPATSLRFLQSAGLLAAAHVLDAGAGLGTLAEALLEKTTWTVSLVDVSAEALAKARVRLEDSTARLQFVVGDVRFLPSVAEGCVDAWHDRAVLHFLVEPKDRAAYAKTVARVVRSGGVVIIAGFALDGPKKCSGLPVVRSTATSIGEVLGPEFSLELDETEEHTTPWGSTQRFVYTRFSPLVMCLYPACRVTGRQ